MDQCKCSDYARDYGEKLLAEHHRNCPNYDPVFDAVGLIKSLLHGIRCWASDEDGVHPECCDAYNRAAIAVGENVLYADHLNPPYKPTPCPGHEPSAETGGEVE